ncbi:hypothetical protein ACHAPD_006342 [Fusarium lateritium]
MTVFAQPPPSAFDTTYPAVNERDRVLVLAPSTSGSGGPRRVSDTVEVERRSGGVVGSGELLRGRDPSSNDLEGTNGELLHGGDPSRSTDEFSDLELDEAGLQLLDGPAPMQAPEPETGSEEFCDCDMPSLPKEELEHQELEARLLAAGVSVGLDANKPNQ